MWDLAAGPKFTQEEFENLRNLIKDNCGIYFDENSKYILEKRTAARLKELKFQSYKEYIFYLKYDKKREEEFVFIYDTLTTNETYFFREEYQLRAFSEEIISDVVKQKGSDRTIRIWSAGCSTGEEPYTIAMLLTGNKDVMSGFKVSVFGSDISHRCLKTAREAVYSSNSFRTTSMENKRRFFDDTEDGKFRVKPHIREMVNFGHLNLLDRQKMGMLPSMDIIFCRNVLIYFDMPSRKTVIENFHEKLQKNGFLLLGHAESLINISTSFIMKHYKNDMVYQKP